ACFCEWPGPDGPLGMLQALGPASYLGRVGNGAQAIGAESAVGKALGDTIPSWSGPLRALTAANFRTNLARFTGTMPAAAQAHHVFPQAFEATFAKIGINIHDPRFGAWWDAAAHSRNSSAYNQDWADFLTTGHRTADEIMQFGRSLGERYGFSV